jgi:hypothetical protein
MTSLHIRSSVHIYFLDRSCSIDRDGRPGGRCPSVNSCALAAKRRTESEPGIRCTAGMTGCIRTRCGGSLARASECPSLSADESPTRPSSLLCLQTTSQASMETKGQRWRRQLKSAEGGPRGNKEQTGRDETGSNSGSDPRRDATSKTRRCEGGWRSRSRFARNRSRSNRSGCPRGQSGA